MYDFLRVISNRPLLAVLTNVWGQALAVSNWKYLMYRGPIAQLQRYDCSNFRQGDIW
jgi:hypothetical protein